MTNNTDLLTRLHKLIQQLESSADPATQSRLREIVQAMMDFHAQAITQMLETIADSETAGCLLIDKLAENELISSMLLLYNLHPLDMDARIGQALEKVRPYLHSHGGNVELLSTTDGIVRLRLQGSCQGCPSSAATLKQTIETAIYEKAPDVLGIEVEGEIAGARLVPLETSNRVALPILSA